VPFSPRAPKILLDTNALIWIEQGHPRSRPLASGPGGQQQNVKLFLREP
jgi:hypothetical protein